MTEMRVEEWLDSHTIFCERMVARFRPEICDARRSADHFACRGCLQRVDVSGVDRVVVAPRVYRKHADVKETVMVESKAKGKAAPRACVECGRVMPISGKGMCGKCYYNLHRVIGLGWR